MIAGGDINTVRMQYCKALTNFDEQVDCKSLIKQKYEEACNAVTDKTLCEVEVVAVFEAQHKVAETSSQTPPDIAKKFLEDMRNPKWKFNVGSGQQKTLTEHLAILKESPAGGTIPTSGADEPEPTSPQPPVESAPAPAPASAVPPAPPADGGNVLPTDIYQAISNAVTANPYAEANLEKLSSACEKVQNKGMCKATFETALNQLHQQTNGDGPKLVEALNNYTTPRSFAGLQNGKGEVVAVNSLAELENLLRTGFGRSGGEVESGGGTSSGWQFGGSIAAGAGSVPFLFDIAKPDSSNGTSGAYNPNVHNREEVDDEEVEEELIENLTQALGSESSVNTGGERTEYATLFPGVRLAFEVLGPASSGLRFAGKIVGEWDRFIGYSTNRTLSTAEHGNLHELSVGPYLGAEYGGAWGSIHLLGGAHYVWGILDGTAQAGPYAGLSEHETALGLRGAGELGYCTPGQASFCVNLNAGYTGYPDNFNRNNSREIAGVPIIGPRPEGHAVWLLTIGGRFLSSP